MTKAAERLAGKDGDAACGGTGVAVAFIAAGLSGLLLTVLVLATVRDPQRGQHEHAPQQDDAPPAGMVLRQL